MTTPTDDGNQDALKFGDRFGGFEIIKEIGHGAMAKVYAAKQVSMERIVALKILNDEWSSNRTYVKRFVKEAQASGKLTHEGIVQVYDVGEVDGRYYIAMEYVRGRNVQRMLAERRLFAPKLATRVVLDIARALRYAQERGIIHRDVKLDNIMIDTSKVVKIMDFGLALEIGERGKGGRGEVMGSPNYISPEQARGEDVDFRTDIYSLGICYYYLLTGRFPFIGRDTENLLKKHLTKPPKPPTGIKEDIPATCEAVCLKMLAKAADDRYKAYADLIADLTAVLADGTPSALTERSTDPPADGTTDMIEVDGQEVEQINTLAGVQMEFLEGEDPIPFDPEAEAMEAESGTAVEVEAPDGGDLSTEDTGDLALVADEADIDADVAVDDEDLIDEADDLLEPEERQHAEAEDDEEMLELGVDEAIEVEEDPRQARRGAKKKKKTRAKAKRPTRGLQRSRPADRGRARRATDEAPVEEPEEVDEIEEIEEIEESPSPQVKAKKKKRAAGAKKKRTLGPAGTSKKKGTRKRIQRLGAKQEPSDADEEEDDDEDEGRARPRLGRGRQQATRSLTESLKKRGGTRPTRRRLSREPDPEDEDIEEVDVEEVTEIDDDEIEELDDGEIEELDDGEIEEYDDGEEDEQDRPLRAKGKKGRGAVRPLRSRKGGRARRSADADDEEVEEEGPPASRRRAKKKVVRPTPGMKKKKPKGAPGRPEAKKAAKGTKKAPRRRTASEDEERPTRGSRAGRRRR